MQRRLSSQGDHRVVCLESRAHEGSAHSCALPSTVRSIRDELTAVSVPLGACPPTRTALLIGGKGVPLTASTNESQYGTL